MQNSGGAGGVRNWEKAGEQSPRDAKLPSAAELNMMAQKYLEHQGAGTSSEIFRQRAGCRLGSRLSKRGTRRIQKDASPAMNYSIGLVRRGSTQIEIPSLPRSLTATRTLYFLCCSTPSSIRTDMMRRVREGL